MNAILAEPIIAQLLGFICGIDAFPSPFTLLGIGLITYATYKNNMSMHVNQKIAPPGTDSGHIPEADSNMEDEQDEAKLENHIRLLEEKLNMMKVEAQGYEGKNEKEIN